MNKKNAFDALDSLATNAPVTKSKKSTTPTVATTPEVAKAVDKFVSAKKQKKEAEAEMEIYGAVVIDHVKKTQDADGRCGKFRNSYDVYGNNEKVKYVSVDKFSVSAEDTINLKGAVGDKFDDMFENTYDIRVKEEVTSDPNKVAELLKKVPVEVLAMFFDVKKVLKTKQGFDEKLYMFSDEQIEEIKTYVKQSKSYLR